MSKITFRTMQAAREDYGSQFEILVSLIFHLIVKAGDVVVDGGANGGLHTFPLAKLVGVNGLVIAIEPIPEIFAGLKNSTSGLSIEYHQLALGDKSGTTSFVVNEKIPAMSHIKHSSDVVAENMREISVSVARLDDIVADRKVSFLKLDLEGSDFLALRGAGTILNRDRPIVVFENSREWACKCYGYSADDFMSYFNNLSYDVYDLHGQKLSRDNWLDDDIAFEFVAFPREKVGESSGILGVVEFFWAQSDARPILGTWLECIKAVREVRDYMARFHGESWERAALSRG